MSEPASGNVFASVQGPPSANTLAEGHRYSGLFVKPDVVVVPQWSRDRVERASDWSVVLVPLSGDKQPAERISASCLELHRKEGDENMLGLVRLARPSKLMPPDLGPGDGGQFLAELRQRDGDLVSVLRARGVSTSPLDLDPVSVLSDVSVDTVETETLVTHGEGHEPWNVPTICWWFGFC